MNVVLDGHSFMTIDVMAPANLAEPITSPLSQETSEHVDHRHPRFESIVFSTVSHVPVIDIGPLLHGSVVERRAVAELIGNACKDMGFFAIVNHDVPNELVARTFAVCAEFFALPQAIKAEIAIEKSSCHSIAGPNQWPADPAAFTPTLREYFGVMTSLARSVVGAFALVLELPEHHFDQYFTASMATASPLRYPSHLGEITEAQLSAGAHSDYGAVTLLAQDDPVDSVLLRSQL